MKIIHIYTYVDTYMFHIHTCTFAQIILMQDGTSYVRIFLGVFSMRNLSTLVFRQGRGQRHKNWSVGVISSPFFLRSTFFFTSSPSFLSLSLFFVYFFNLLTILRHNIRSRSYHPSRGTPVPKMWSIGVPLAGPTDSSFLFPLFSFLFFFFAFFIYLFFSFLVRFFSRFIFHLRQLVLFLCTRRAKDHSRVAASSLQVTHGHSSQPKLKRVLDRARPAFSISFLTKSKVSYLI